jgi:hypothetical protein
MKTIQSGATKALDISTSAVTAYDENSAAAKLALLGSDGKITSSETPDLPVIGAGYGTCATAAGTAAKVGTLANFVLKTGSPIAIKFTNADTSTNPTLNVNSTGAKSIHYNGTNIKAGMITAGYVAEFVYDGGTWHLLNPAPGSVGGGDGWAEFIRNGADIDIIGAIGKI